MTQKSRKIRALAAGGAVLGIGAAITLAAWSDSEFAEGSFSSGAFGIEAATDGDDWSNNPDRNEPLTLAFDVAAAEAMAPGETVASPYQIRNVENGADSVVTFAEEEITEDLGEDLTAEILQVGSAECTPDSTGETLELGGTFALTGQEPEYLCVQVTLDSEFDSLTPVDGSILWHFEANQVVDEAEV